MKANSADAAQNLTGDQYSTIGSAGYWAQLAWQPFSAYLIVKVPPRILMPVSPTINL
jgi:hypothetical protein